MLSNYLQVDPKHSVRRYDRKQRQMVMVDQPDIIHQYNKRMGGVDLFDNAMNNYRICLRGKKWYWPLITNGLDAAMVNAWKLHCAIRSYQRKNATISKHGSEKEFKQMPQFEFRNVVTDSLLQSEVVAYHRGPKTQDTPSQKRLRLDNVAHNIEKKTKRLRCRYCASHTIYYCAKCRVAVHPKCFSAYHTGNKE